MKEDNIEELINEVFEKAKRHCVSHKKNALSKYIVEEIEGDFEISFDKVTLSRAYDKFVLKTKPENSNPSIITVEYLCKFLGYNSYKEYVESKENDSRKSVDLRNNLNENFQNITSTEKLESNNILFDISQKGTLKKRVLISSVIGILILIIFGLFINLYVSPFNIDLNLSKKSTLKLHPDYPKLGEEKKAMLRFYLPTGVLEKEVDNMHEATLTNLAYNFLGTKIKIELVDKFWKLSKDSIVLKRGNSVLTIEPNNSLSEINGEVLEHFGGLPINNVIIQVEGMETKTNVLGMFSIKVPYEKRRIQYELSIYKEGYNNYKKIYYAGAKVQIRLTK